MAQKRLHSTCSDCKTLVQYAATSLSSSGGARFDFTYDYEYQSRLLANVASSTCHMCTLLLAEIPLLSEPFQSGQDRQIIVQAPNDPLTASIQLGFSNDASGDHWHGTYRGSLGVMKAAQGNITVLESAQTWSLETLNCIRSWLEGCTSCHDTCTEPKDSFRLPLRLIDVNASNTVQTQRGSDMTLEGFDQLRLENSHGVRIITTKSLPPDTEYLTLSHRWGSPPSIMLTQETSFLLVEDISPHLLKCEEAVAFKHAMHVTRALGFRYIWIDSLCIMQDDDSEKAAEIMQMDNIYFNCKLNISAAEADLSTGLIFDRNPLLANPCITAAKDPATQEDVQLYVFQEWCSLRPEEKPLHRRGWVFQERALAQRIIHFTKDLVFWECWSLEATETLTHGIPGPRSRSPDLGKSVGLRSTTFDAQKTRWRWYDLVQAYSSTTCTYSDDRLLAISALAKRFCSALHADPSEYLAGIWKDDLPLSLDWYQDVEESTYVKSASAENESKQEYKYAPSWSWASIMAPIEFAEHQYYQATTEVVDIEVQRRSPNLFDGTIICRLQLRGFLCKFRWYVRDGFAWIRIPADTYVQEFYEYKAAADVRSGVTINILWDTARRPFRKDECFLLHLKAGSDDSLRHRGLVLLRAAHRGTYRRVGLFLLSTTHEYSGSKLEAAFEGHLNTLSAEDYLEMDSNGRYIFNLI